MTGRINHRTLLSLLLASGLTTVSYAARADVAPADCPASVKPPAVPESLAAAIDRLNTLDRDARQAAFAARADAIARARPSDPLLALYTDHVALLPRLRYVEGRGELERNTTAIEALSAADQCRLRALFEHPRAGVRIGGLFAYRPASIEALGARAPERVREMMAIFEALGRLYHRLGARRHFFDITYDFVDVFEPIRRTLTPDLAERATTLLADLGRRRTELFGDLPAGTRTMPD